MQIAFLKDFHKHICDDVFSEFDEIDKRNENGKFPDISDYEGALNYPYSRLEIASKAIIYEPNALIETVLYKIAEPFWEKSDKVKVPKHVLELKKVHPESLAKVRAVTDIRLKEVRNLIEENYGINLDSLNGWEEFEEIRRQANAFKHREGWKHKREVNWWSKNAIRNLSEVKYDVRIESAEKKIDEMDNLLGDLQIMVRKKGAKPS